MTSMLGDISPTLSLLPKALIGEVVSMGADREEADFYMVTATRWLFRDENGFDMPLVDI